MYIIQDINESFNDLEDEDLQEGFDASLRCDLHL